MTERQKAFADYYLACGNAAEAARKAGYSEKTADRTGSEYLRKPEIAAYIQKRLADMERRRVADADEVMAFFTSVMRGDLKDARGRRQSVPVKERLRAGEALIRRHTAVTNRAKESEERLDQLLKEFRDAVIGEAD